MVNYYEVIILSRLLPDMLNGDAQKFPTTSINTTNLAAKPDHKVLTASGV